LNETLILSKVLNALGSSAILAMKQGRSSPKIADEGGGLRPVLIGVNNIYGIRYVHNSCMSYTYVRGKYGMHHIYICS
jgi:hypothetical protein